jgi:predicted transcriptional regulator
MHLKNLAKVTRKIKTYVSILQTLKKLHKKHQSSIKGKQVAI